jgi:hypothetical protein
LLAALGGAQVALLAAVAFVAATVSGMSGVGGALLMAIFIAPVVGVKAVVPTVGIATLIAHVARVWVYRESIVWRPALLMLLGAIPATIASARLYVALPADVIAVVLGLFLLASVPLRRALADPAHAAPHPPRRDGGHRGARCLLLPVARPRRVSRDAESAG